MAACPPRERSPILFVGSLAYRVNERAIDRFLQRVWPLVLGEEPGAAFRIVGSGLSNRQRQSWSLVPGVKVVGFVEELRREYADAAFTVVPIFEGSGTKIKVLESLLFGRTCVATRHALRGFEEVLLHQQALWVADTDEELARGCVVCLRGTQLRNRLAARGRAEVVKHFSFERFQNIVTGTLENVLRAHHGVVERV
jgi:glycosyltransferase involved in cell wall biosynthesis